MGQQALEEGRGVRGDEESAWEQHEQPRPGPPRHLRDPPRRCGEGACEASRRRLPSRADTGTRHVLCRGSAQTHLHRNTADIPSGRRTNKLWWTLAEARWAARGTEPTQQQGAGQALVGWAHGEPDFPGHVCLRASVASYVGCQRLTVCNDSSIRCYLIENADILCSPNIRHQTAVNRPQEVGVLIARDSSSLQPGLRCGHLELQESQTPILEGAACGQLP